MKRLKPLFFALQITLKMDKKWANNGQKNFNWINLYHSFKKVDKYGPKKMKN